MIRIEAIIDEIDGARVRCPATNIIDEVAIALPIRLIVETSMKSSWAVMVY